MYVGAVIKGQQVILSHKSCEDQLELTAYWVHLT